MSELTTNKDKVKVTQYKQVNLKIDLGIRLLLVSSEQKIQLMEKKYESFRRQTYWGKKK